MCSGDGLQQPSECPGTASHPGRGMAEMWWHRLQLVGTGPLPGHSLAVQGQHGGVQGCVEGQQGVQGAAVPQAALPLPPGMSSAGRGAGTVPASLAVPAAVSLSLHVPQSSHSPLDVLSHLCTHSQPGLQPGTVWERHQVRSGGNPSLQTGGSWSWLLFLPRVK